MVDYPYSLDTLLMLGYYYYGTPIGLNSGMWIEEGVGAAGLAGVPLISLIGAVVLWLFDSLSARVPTRFVACASAVIAMDFLNVPLSTTLIACGMALLAVLMYLMPPQAATERRRNGR